MRDPWARSAPSQQLREDLHALLELAAPRAPSEDVEAAPANNHQIVNCDRALAMLTRDCALLGGRGPERVMTTMHDKLGYWTHPDARGRGVMTEAVGLVIDHALTAASEGGMGLRRIQLLAAAGNAASAHIARRTGFVEVGRERQAELLGDGSYDDLITFDLLASQWRPMHRPGATPSG